VDARDKPGHDGDIVETLHLKMRVWSRNASTSIQRRRHPLCHGIQREEIQRNALNFGRSAFALRNRDKQVAPPRHGDADGRVP
jgi:hypothetical protein